MYAIKTYKLDFLSYQRKITLPQVNPLPKAERTTISPSLTRPCCRASVRAIGKVAAVVLPYF